MKKLLITGASGFVGQRAVRYYSTRYAVSAPSHREMDLTDEASVMNYLQNEHPDFVLHCAALSDTGYCQQHPDESLHVNIEGTVHVARASDAVGAKFVYMSSDQVYNGNSETRALTETDEVKPKNVYGVHKLQTEREVQMFFPSSVGLRLTWMYDVPESPLRLNRNILVNLRNAVQEGGVLRGAVGELRGITNVWTVVENFEKCFSLPGGIYNYGSENPLNSYETFLAAARLFYPDKADTSVERNDDFSRNLSMNIDKLRSHGISFPDTVEGFRLCAGK